MSQHKDRRARAKSKARRRRQRRRVKPRDPNALAARMRNGGGFHRDKSAERERRICREKVEIPA